MRTYGERLAVAPRGHHKPDEEETRIAGTTPKPGQEDRSGLLDLQRLVGNRAVTAMLSSDPAIQRKKGKGDGADVLCSREP